MEHFRKESIIAAPAQLVFSWHETADAFEKLTPPWERARIVERSAPGIKSGTRIVIETSVGPFKFRWVATHTAHEPGRMFRDEQMTGPFRVWVHTHIVEPQSPHTSVLVDDIRYQLRLGFVGKCLGGWWVRRKLERLFHYRHGVTKAACELAASHS
jgi:ligand-binding SRPBCC domain-containing protein